MAYSPTIGRALLYSARDKRTRLLTPLYVSTNHAINELVHSREPIGAWTIHDSVSIGNRQGLITALISSPDAGHVSILREKCSWVDPFLLRNGSVIVYRPT